MLKLDKNNFPRLVPDLNLGTIISPIKSGTGRGNPAHNSATGQFTFLPRGVTILEGLDLAKGLSTPTAKMFRERAQAVGANQAALRVINGNLVVVLLHNGKRLNSFQVEPKSHRQSQDPNQQDIPTQQPAKITDQERDYILQFARDLNLSGSELAKRFKQVLQGIDDTQIQQLAQQVDLQRQDDLVHYLDRRLRIEVRKENISDNEVKIAVGRGFLRRSFATITSEQVSIVIARLRGLGWSPDELKQGLTGKLPKRFKELVSENATATGKGIRQADSKAPTGDSSARERVRPIQKA